MFGALTQATGRSAVQWIVSGRMAEARRRLLHSDERMILTPRPGNRTLIEVRITYTSKEVRDIVLGTGMIDGMESSYARLERTILDVR